MKHPHGSMPRRSGLSLLEVVIALAIFLFSLAGISQLVNVANDRSLEVQLQLQATQLCQTKLAELSVGVVPLMTQTDVPFLDDPEWQWSVECNPGPIEGLWSIRVSISRSQSNGSRRDWSLSQAVLDPSLRANPPMRNPLNPAAPTGESRFPSPSSAQHRWKPLSNLRPGAVTATSPEGRP